MADDGTPSPSASAETVVPPARSVESEHEQGSPQHESSNSQDEIADEETSSDDRDTASQDPTQPTHDIDGEQIFFQGLKKPGCAGFVFTGKKVDTAGQWKTLSGLPVNLIDWDSAS